MNIARKRNYEIISHKFFFQFDYKENDFDVYLF